MNSAMRIRLAAGAPESNDGSNGIHSSSCETTQTGRFDIASRH